MTNSAPGRRPRSSWPVPGGDHDPRRMPRQGWKGRDWSHAWAGVLLIATGLNTACSSGDSANASGQGPASSAGGGGPSDGTGGAGPGVTTGPGGNPGLTPWTGTDSLRHLTRSEFSYSIQDLVGDDAVHASAAKRVLFQGPTKEFLFASGGEPLTKTEVESLNIVASEVIAGASIQAGDCPGDAAAALECARGVIHPFARRAYRSVPSAEQLQSLDTLYTDARTKAQLDHAGAMQVVFEGILQSPYFVYTQDFGPSRDAFRIASNLSFLLWSTAPDEQLLAAASNGSLLTLEGLTLEANRLLADAPRLSRTLGVFADSWLSLYKLPDAAKDSGLYPMFKDPLKAAMAEESRRFLVDVVTARDASFRTLLSSPETFVNADLAPLYGVDPAGVGAELVKVALDPQRRAGLLTHGSFLTVTGAVAGSHPSRRGKAVYEGLLCRVVPEPPGDVAPLPPAQATQTTRERFAEHLKAECASCHKVFDPLGFAFENYDGIGAYRTEENGTLVDATGTLVLDNVEQSFNGAVQLSQLLASSNEAASCFSKQWVRYALKRDPSAADQALLDSTSMGFTTSQLNIRQLLLSLAQTLPAP